jgi:hypothetical protein
VNELGVAERRERVGQLSAGKLADLLEDRNNGGAAGRPLPRALDTDPIGTGL